MAANGTAQIHHGRRVRLASPAGSPDGGEASSIPGGSAPGAPADGVLPSSRPPTVMAAPGAPPGPGRQGADLMFLVGPVFQARGGTAAAAARARDDHRLFPARACLGTGPA